jgi:integrase
LRRGEVFGLTWGDVALERGEARIRQALKRPAKGKAYIGPPKSKAGRRSVPLPSWALAALTAHRAALGAMPLPNVSVFVNEDGGAIHFSNFARRVWVPLREAAKLPESVTFHALRHTAATLLLGSGVDVRTAQGIIGHARGSTTLDVYADYIPSNAERAMAGLDAMIASAESAKGA